MTTQQTKQPDAQFLDRFLSASLRAARGYSLTTAPVSTKLDQNEHPYDWPAELKQKVVNKLLESEWNRYPADYADDLAEKVARYNGLDKGTVLLGPGSNMLCTLAIDAFTQNLAQKPTANQPGKLVIARPSFALYEAHCAYSNIAYEPWLLDQHLEFSPAAISNLPEGSVVVFASPNNPVGNVLTRAQFAELLAANPKSMFIADEAYFEFANEPYTPLFAKFHNFISIRTFSKTLAGAGVRIGMILGAPQFIQELRKLRVPFMLNYFALAAGHVLLDEPRQHIADTVARVVGERRRVLEALKPILGKTAVVKDSQANFLLLRFQSQAKADEVCKDLIKRDVLIRDVSRGPGLTGCLRATIGTEEENSKFLAAIKQTLA